MDNFIEVRIIEDCKLFLDQLDENSRRKVFYNIKRTMQGQKGEWFQKLRGTDDIWEFRTLYNGQYIRLLAFYQRSSGGNESIIICTSGFIKKSDKTPVSEIKKAESRKMQYQSSI